MSSDLQANVYQNAALKTESVDMIQILERLQNPKLVRMLHAAMGVATEAGELVDILKKHIFYGKELDEDRLVHFMEEMGDLSWYIAIGSDAIGQKLSVVLERNIAKLSARYEDKFRASEALERNLEAENVALGRSESFTEE